MIYIGTMNITMEQPPKCLYSYRYNSAMYYLIWLIFEKWVGYSSPKVSQ